MNSTIEFFGGQASLYDAYQRNCVPRYGEAVSVAAGWLDRLLIPKRGARIIDLGCGTGNTTEELVRLFPDGIITCVDGSREMIAVARTKLENREMEFHCRDLTEPGWNEPLLHEPVDAVVSVFVLEHLPFDAYRKVLADILNLMKPGGRLVTVEGFSGDTCQEIYFEEMALWEQRAVQSGIVTREQLDDVKRLSSEKEVHYFAAVDDKKAWWAEAGLTDVDLIWYYYCIGVLVGRKPL
ncbi:MAG: class I SAM-dependent methyltransferase [Desulfomonilaceae bacterium]|nr:class I SAM-dependent methyltransferase [Desulfomonilaceae bacterium]